MVVNNVGGNGVMVPFPQLRFPGWTKVMRLNVDSAVHVLQAAAPHMLERRTGSVINVASVAGLSATPAMAQYGASKAALISLTRTLAVEWASTGVRFNALCPGWTATDLNRTLWENEEVYAGLTATIPMGRWPGPRRWPARRCSWPATRRRHDRADAGGGRGQTAV